MTEQEIKNIYIKYSNNSLPCSTDKASFHAYEEFYPSVFLKYLNKDLNILEIGVADGSSLKILEEIFPKANIYGVDKDYSILCKEMDFSKINILPPGDQADENSYKNTPMFDIIIDDASHIPDYTEKTFFILEPKLKKGGIYIIEDMHTDLFPQFSPDFLLKMKIVDLRSIKNRNDDTLFAYEK